MDETRPAGLYMQPVDLECEPIDFADPELDLRSAIDANGDVIVTSV